MTFNNTVQIIRFLSVIFPCWYSGIIPHLDAVCSIYSDSWGGSKNLFIGWILLYFTFWMDDLALCLRPCFNPSVWRVLVSKDITAVFSAFIRIYSIVVDDNAANLIWYNLSKFRACTGSNWLDFRDDYYTRYIRITLLVVCDIITCFKYDGIHQCASDILLEPVPHIKTNVSCEWQW